MFYTKNFSIKSNCLDLWHQNILNVGTFEELSQSHLRMFFLAFLSAVGLTIYSFNLYEQTKHPRVGWYLV